jgi:hypothetical protein
MKFLKLWGAMAKEIKKQQTPRYIWNCGSNNDNGLKYLLLR